MARFASVYLYFCWHISCAEHLQASSLPSQVNQPFKSLSNAAHFISIRNSKRTALGIVLYPSLKMLPSRPTCILLSHSVLVTWAGHVICLGDSTSGLDWYFFHKSGGQATATHTLLLTTLSSRRPPSLSGQLVAAAMEAGVKWGQERWGEIRGSLQGWWEMWEGVGWSMAGCWVGEAGHCMT